MTDMNAVLIHTDGRTETIKLPQAETRIKLQALQYWCEAEYVDRITLPEHFVAWFDDDGRGRHDLNPLGTMIVDYWTGADRLPASFDIHGPILFTKYTDDGETIGLNSVELEKLQQVITLMSMTFEAWKASKK